MFAGKAGAYSSEAPYMCSTLRVGSWLYSQTLDYTIKALWVKNTLSYYEHL